MLDQLMQMIQQQGQDAVVNNADVPNEHNEAVMQETQSAITGGLQQLASSGELNQLAQNPQALAGHPAVQNISNNFMGAIMQKFGLSEGAASDIAGSLIPSILGKVMGAVQQGDSGFDLGGLLSSFTGGDTAQSGQQSVGGIMNTISNLGAKFGLDKDGDGDVDMNDLSKLIK
ncbi:hypothetical protein F0919_11415 [Taibaiella lutea]|uniref:EF-hand domain-containing protein n=1 Tax=Taibaiella lutea TaxID=2608001 RepID=A0A5M6CDH9_9BACT|nr:hypothetical protein [Taibaiella lutea]KAA5533151.1 hypothetical protein F0919_11415 [Taibaiella lutea]